ncbi:hypothetical protein FQR65_LT07339 [Abscondita terminalis]|nr:hypothetical protein FQR65_LT07339 [Abscondita terminalis]
MSSLSLNCEDVERIPDLRVVNQKHLLSLPEYQYNEEIKANLLETIKSQNMAPFYEKVCGDLNWTVDEELLEEMKKGNEIALTYLNETIDNVKASFSTSEVRDAYMAKAKYLMKIGDKDNALQACRQAFGHSVATGCKIENVLACTRLGFFTYDPNLIERGLSRADDLACTGVDYEKRNRLRIYKGLYGILIRDFSLASEMFLNTIATFACNELMDYTSFIQYTVISAIFSLPRVELKQKIIDDQNILEALHQTTESLVEIEKLFRENYILYPHYQYYIREMRVKAYVQFLVSYKSLTLDHMAQAFAVTPEFLEEEIFKCINAGKIFGKIDKISKCIVMTPGVSERRSELFEEVIKQGDIVLNRVQRLSRILDYSL